MKHTLLIVISFTFYTSLFSQNNNVGINTNTPDPSSILHLEADDKGLLVPRLTTLQRDAIAAPATGLIIYNTDENQEEIYNGTCWIPSYLEDCSDCMVDITFQQANYVIDRINNMNVTIPVTINQTTSNGQNLPLSLALIHTFSEETDVTLSQYAITGSGTVNLDIATNVFETGGVHYVTVFTTCGEKTFAQTVVVDITPCQQINITTDQTDYDLSANGVTGNSCVVVTINENVAMRSSDNTIPAFTTGGINPACNLGILNEGYFFGRGGDGPLLMGQNGEDGGTAIELNCPTEIRNQGMIYGGGGSGLTVGAFQAVQIGPFSLCFAIGAGGGGGMPNGLGGGDTQGTCTLVVGIWQEGNDAGPNYDDFEGAAVSENFSQGFSLGPVNGNISITANGGGGGDFGEPGTGSSQPVDFSGTSFEICINIPLVGNVCVPIPGVDTALNALANTINNQFNTSVPGAGGYAVKHNGAPINISDGDYQTFSIRGAIGN